MFEDFLASWPIMVLGFLIALAICYFTAYSQQPAALLPYNLASQLAGFFASVVMWFLAYEIGNPGRAILRASVQIMVGVGVYIWLMRDGGPLEW